MYYETLINGVWVKTKPTVTGQRYRLYDIAGGIFESYWYQSEE